MNRKNQLMLPEEAARKVKSFREYDPSGVVGAAYLLKC
jgi:hypothetical protein